MQKVVYILCLVAGISCLNSVWEWKCDQNYCQKKRITNETESSALSLPACRLLCNEYAALWPKPTGANVAIGKNLNQININSIDVRGPKYESKSFDLWDGARKLFVENIQGLVPTGVTPTGGKTLQITADISDTNKVQLTLDTDESYKLSISETADGRIEAKITAANFFGARHGLETLSQLIVYDELRDQLIMVTEATIEDKPAYPYRGILLDTARSYMSVDAIKRTIKAMGASKLNTFHWHITDSHSFPFVSEKQPTLSKLGAYTPKKIYSPADIASVINYGTMNGVRVMPEFDAPAHVGEGWQDTDLVTCRNWQPWQDYCVEPPCGQFDPTKSQLYDVIEDIYSDMFKQFNPDIFHMGGDEVNLNCWNSTDSIVAWMANKGWGRSEQDFIKLWNEFQSQALERVYKVAGKQVPVIMWTSHLTQKEYVLDYLPKEKYFIQIWTKGDDPQVSNLLENGYKLILSNYDALYLDCGFGGWVTDGNNWCSPYIGWQKVYENKPGNIAGNKKDQILGAESTLWSEQVDSTAVDSRLWPRAAAMAEVLWSEPTTSWRDAEQRILVHRERLASRGINADLLEPEWCVQNEENCPIGGKFNTK